MNLRRRHFNASLIGGTAAAIAAGAAGPAFAARPKHKLLHGKLFTIGNAAAGNVLHVYDADPAIAEPLTSAPTGGLGSGAGLGSQGAVTLSVDGRWLLVVNAGSHTVSCFALSGRGLSLVSVASSGGLGPISVSERHGLVYVVNAESSQVSGLRMHNGVLSPLADSTQYLSSADAVGPAQVSIAPDGDVVIVTEKGTNLVTHYSIDHDGRIGAPQPRPSPGQTPFGFAFDRRGRFFVSEASGGATGASTVSSYRIDDDEPVVISAAVPNGQGAACWAATTPDGRFVYVTNTGSGNLSRYAIAPDGSISLDAAIAGVTGAGTSPTDFDLPRHGRTMHVLAGGPTRRIYTFDVGSGGELTAAGSVVVPAGTVGLAAN
ncbi:MAG: beta-propeller fold lactonase family protein [Rubrivivax sp.]